MGEEVEVGEEAEVEQEVMLVMLMQVVVVVQQRFGWGCLEAVVSFASYCVWVRAGWRRGLETGPTGRG